MLDGVEYENPSIVFLEYIKVENEGYKLHCRASMIKKNENDGSSSQSLNIPKYHACFITADAVVRMDKVCSFCGTS